MIKHKNEMRLRTREGIRGGNGVIEDLNILEPEEMLGKCSLFTRFYLDPGDSIGYHSHPDDAEVYYVLSGQLTVIQDDGDVVLGPGDVAFTHSGGSHSVENRSKEPAEMLAVIFN